MTRRERWGLVAGVAALAVLLSVLAGCLALAAYTCYVAVQVAG